MASTQQLKGRIASVKNTKQITKAMEMVAASKMRKAQNRALASRDYKNMGLSILSRIAELTDASDYPLYKKRPPQNRLIVVFTSDRGLAGAYNSNIFKKLTLELKLDQNKDVKSHLIIFGRKGSLFSAKLKDVKIIAAYTDFSESPSVNDIRPILNDLLKNYTKQNFDIIDLLYTNYKSRMVQEVTLEHFLPAALNAQEPDRQFVDQTMFEPSVSAVLESVTERLLEVQLSQAMFEAQASEQSMRMMAMKNATDNASDLVDDLTLEFNTARQASITQELAEITGGAEAIAT